ncbi:uncharacterized protein SPPG_01014 [Spizellomyces punctatus DAOM BR117]|uniref:Alpha/beta hydrolase fold-3 domain-containing protein n=1 Tax=Spizellomyces punctatus (strain DAOM BR117) TaxID=645134 RepID=A0A0L0HR43_SPIPD|nr:uncharacterized protein SPPG_01014 [Spizellomyces punctatus DAOM BR117]KND03533.1 hypothetical protein SPPG_01014 [Spizellomyces punctatus DAOM BR117]|eukprot:XP_016611572.1 hypothetical protein SPPG_01014 [Spizellomyces punctatus DAOM BR117]
MSKELVTLTQNDAENPARRLAFLWGIVGAWFSRIDVWLRGTRHNTPLFALYALFKLVHVFFRRLLTGPLVPVWSYKAEVGIALLQYGLHSDLEFVRTLLTRASNLTIGRGTVVYVDEENLKGSWLTLRDVKPVLHVGVRDAKGLSVQTPLTIFYVHGGGYCFGMPLMYQSQLLQLLRDLKESYGIAAQIFCVKYPLSPEVPFPGAIDSVIAAYNALLAHMFDPSRIILGGDSAGGGLVLNLLQHLRSTAPSKLPLCANLISPFVNQQATAPSMVANEPYDFLSRRSILDMAGRYRNSATFPAPDDPGLAEPRVSPINGDVHGLPPLLVTVGTKEIFLDDVNALVSKCQQSGVIVELDVGEGMVHNYPLLEQVFGRPAREGLGRIATWMAKMVKDSQQQF